MNYKKLHDGIISKARSEARSKWSDVYEQHHIIPVCLGGTDDISNLVLLRPREHFIVHYLLWKINPIRKLLAPLLYFYHKIGQSRLYEAARTAHIEEMTNNNPSLHLSDIAKQSKSKKLKSHIKTAEHRKNIGLGNKGKRPRLGAILSNECKLKIAESVSKWHKQIGISDETREKLKIASTGRKFSLEMILKMSNMAKARKKYQCEYCNRNLDGGNFAQHMNKYHGWCAEQIRQYKGNHGIIPKAFEE
jgi:hypothetical protein